MKKLQVLGTGCATCRKLAELVEETATDLGIEFEMVKVEDIDEIVRFGVMSTPALAVDGELKVSGRVPSKDELREIIG